MTPRTLPPVRTALRAAEALAPLACHDAPRANKLSRAHAARARHCAVHAGSRNAHFARIPVARTFPETGPAASRARHGVPPLRVESGRALDCEQHPPVLLHQRGRVDRPSRAGSSGPPGPPGPSLIRRRGGWPQLGRQQQHPQRAVTLLLLPQPAHGLAPVVLDVGVLAEDRLRFVLHARHVGQRAPVLGVPDEYAGRKPAGHLGNVHGHAHERAKSGAAGLAPPQVERLVDAGDVLDGLGALRVPDAPRRAAAEREAVPPRLGDERRVGVEQRRQREQVPVLEGRAPELDVVKVGQEVEPGRQRSARIPIS